MDNKYKGWFGGGSKFDPILTRTIPLERYPEQISRLPIQLQIAIVENRLKAVQEFSFGR